MEQLEFECSRSMSRNVHQYGRNSLRSLSVQEHVIASPLTTT